MAISGAVAIGVGTAGAGIYSSNKQAKAASQAGALEQQQYLQTRADLLAAKDELQQGTEAQTQAYNPYIQAGTRADKLVQDLSGVNGPEAQRSAYLAYQESPAVAFAREQGTRGLEQDLVAAGVGGGTRLKELSRFNQGLALQDFNNQYNRIASQGDIGRAALTDQINARLNALGAGLTTAQQIGQFGERSATNQADALTASAAARASRGTSIMEGITSGIKAYGGF